LIIGFISFKKKALIRDDLVFRNILFFLIGIINERFRFNGVGLKRFIVFLIRQNGKLIFLVSENEKLQNNKVSSAAEIFENVSNIRNNRMNNFRVLYIDSRESTVDDNKPAKDINKWPDGVDKDNFIKAFILFVSLKSFFIG
jgi:hypothetical protein